MEAFILGLQFVGLSISHEQVIDHMVVRHDKCLGLRVLRLGKLVLVHNLTSESCFAPFTTFGMDPVMEFRMILVRLTPVLLAAMLEEVVLDGTEDLHTL